MGISLKVGMIDVDLLNNGTRHPNLAQMKMSSYCKSLGHDVKLIFSNYDLNHLSEFDFLLVSKVFNFTPVPAQLQKVIDESGKTLNELNNIVLEDCLKKYSDRRPETTVIHIGGTGFFENGGKDLEENIEHIMPDYDLYTEYVNEKIKEGRTPSYFSDYSDCSIGFLSRGCFRQCSFCVNKKYTHAFVCNRTVDSFFKPGSKVIYLWDDNFLALGHRCLDLLDDLIEKKVSFQFRQGLDLRLMTDEYAEKLSKCRYHGDYIFAFDHIQDKEIIKEKLGIWRKHCKKETKLYVLCGYDARSNDPKYGINTNISVEKRDLVDIENTFERISILMRYRCLPYIMRYISYKESPYRGIYTQLARWCNQPSHFKKMSFEEFCLRNQEYSKSDKPCASMRALNLLKKDAPEIYEKYATRKFMYAGRKKEEEID